MGSKREEERNEKIIRGLMKLPPNRRCINCNNLGPQYVCTNFWTFICQTCSGIHREFTHRVKSVSMAKFTSQEVEALQKGGNQRARETYLVHWEPQRQRQPNSSNIEKVREFIKHVYVDKKYCAGITSDKPPRETLNLGNPEDVTRRASSYHSYSQSPPYDYQYEERRYGKQLPALTRKPGSDRGLYDGKVSTFSSPSRFSDQTLEHPRPSDYSVSSPGLSPSCQKDGRVRSPSYQIRSPSYQTTDNIAKENSERFGRTQRATSSGSFGSFDSNSMSFKSNNSASLADCVSGTEQSAESIQDKQYSNPSLQNSSTSGNFGGLDLFEAPFAPPNVAPSLAVDLFQLPERQAKAPIDVPAPSYTSSVPNVHAQKPSEKTFSSLSFFSQMPLQLPPATMGTKSQDEVIHNNDEWAMFDFPQHMPPDNPLVVHSASPGVPNGGYIEKVDTQVDTPGVSSDQQWPVFEGINVHDPMSILNPGAVPSAPSGVLPNGGYIEKVDSLPVPLTGQQWPVFEGSGQAPESTLINNLAHEPTSMHNLWHREPYKSEVSCTNIQQSWNAFEDPTRQLSYSATQQSGQEVVGEAPVRKADEHFGQSWNAFEDPTRQLSESATHQSSQEVAGHAPFLTADEHLGQSWNAFEDPTRQLSYSATHQSGQEVAGQAPFTTADEHLGDFNQARFERVALESRPPITSVPLRVQAHSLVIERKSSNPFDLSDDCDYESGSIYFNMNSLQAALPSGQLTNSIVDDVTQPWFAHNPAPHSIPASQGALGYMGGPAASAQMPNIAAQEPVASVGGNPFS